eukprot:5904944-Alexandrium_andersonii.AAC.1
MPDDGCCRAAAKVWRLACTAAVMSVQREAFLGAVGHWPRAHSSALPCIHLEHLHVRALRRATLKYHPA